MKLILISTALFIALLITSALVLNPNKEAHVDKIFEAKIETNTHHKTQNKFTNKIKDILTSKPARKIKSAFLNYNNYYLFSYTSTKIKNKKITYGFFGFVFIY